MKNTDYNIVLKMMNALEKTILNLENEVQTLQQKLIDKDIEIKRLKLLASYNKNFSEMGQS